MIVGLRGSWTERSQALGPDPPIQDFDIDMVICLAHNLGTTPDPTVELPGFPKGVCPPENLLLGATPDESDTIYIGPGDRIGLPYTYHGPGWQLAADGAIPDGLQTGDVKSQVDLGCDGLVDVFADSTNPGPPPPVTLPGAIPEPFIERTTAWDGDPNEQFLSTTLPGLSLGSRLVRQRADIDTLFLVNGTIRFLLKNVAPLNNTTLALNFGPGARMTGTTLSGNPAAPTTTLLCLQGPQQSVSNTFGVAGLTPVRGNPLPVGDANGDGIDDASGIYAIWSTEVSSPDVVSGDVSFVLVTNCKVITDGTPQAHTDADSDCLEDANSPNIQPGRPTDPDNSDWDVDNDGLPDGVEVAWGSGPEFRWLGAAVISDPPASCGDVGPWVVSSTAGINPGDILDVIPPPGIGPAVVWESVKVEEILEPNGIVVQRCVDRTGPVDIGPGWILLNNNRGALVRQQGDPWLTAAVSPLDPTLLESSLAGIVPSDLLALRVELTCNAKVGDPVVFVSGDLLGARGAILPAPVTLNAGWPAGGQETVTVIGTAPLPPGDPCNTTGSAFAYMLAAPVPGPAGLSLPLGTVVHDRGECVAMGPAPQACDQEVVKVESIMPPGKTVQRGAAGTLPEAWPAGTMERHFITDRFLADMDGDGRTDLEEKLGPTQFLSNPLNWDTDGDGVQDAGLRADCNQDGVPDSMAVDVAPGNPGRIRVRVEVCHTPSGIPGDPDEVNKTPFGPRGARLAGNTDGSHPLAPAVGDNCPSIPNPGQENLDILPIDGDRLPADDVTNPHKDYYGDACDEDDDGDAMNDGAEARFAYYPGNAGPPAKGPECHMDGDSTDAGGPVPDGYWTVPAGYPDAGANIPVTPLKVTDTVGGNLVAVPDTDYDGTLDGVECELYRAAQGGIPEGASNPNSAAIKVAACSAVGDIDSDTDGLCVPGGTHSNVETYFRTQGIMTLVGGVPTMNDNPDADTKFPGDSDADSDTVYPSPDIADGVEAKGWFGESGPGAASQDSDRDGCPDFVQIGSIDGNRAVSTADALTIVKAATGLLVPLPLTNQEKHVLDVDRNGIVGTPDAVVVAKLPATTCSIYW